MQQKVRAPQQVLYQNRWVDKEHFRAYVYNKSGKYLSNSYAEFTNLLESGKWFASQEEVPKSKANILTIKNKSDAPKTKVVL